MQMHNASNERFKIQCDSKVFKFEPNAATEVPDALYTYIYEMTKNRGVFPVMGEDKEKFESDRLHALSTYRNFFLRERIANYYAQQDDFKKKGVTLLPERAFERALRWDKELAQLLNEKLPLDEELSFIPPVSSEAEELPEVIQSKKPGRPKKEILAEVN